MLPVREYHRLTSQAKSQSHQSPFLKGLRGRAYQRLAHDPEVEGIFQDAMHELCVQVNADLARFVDFSGIRHVVDVGDGDGQT